ncbi:MAG: hypothetical protein ACFCBW_03380 [Candidatus Competibacterales bacterium]
MAPGPRWGAAAVGPILVLGLAPPALGVFECRDERGQSYIQAQPCPGTGAEPGEAPSSGSPTPRTTPSGLRPSERRFLGLDDDPRATEEGEAPGGDVIQVPGLRPSEIQLLRDIEAREQARREAQDARRRREAQDAAEAEALREALKRAADRAQESAD